MGCCQGKCLGSGGYLGKEFLALQEQTEAQRSKFSTPMNFVLNYGR